MLTTKRKAIAYITHRGRLLVFRHMDMPEAGIQVPAGTIEDGETPAAAVLREAQEETGLTNLALVRLLGEQMRDMRDFGKDEIHHRYFYHLRCQGQSQESWRHIEMHNPERPVFELFWVALPDGVPPLIADHGIMLPHLIERAGDP